MVKHDLPIPTTFSSQHAIGNMQNMMSTILNLYSWVSFFSGNLHTQKTNKAHKKWANITRIYHFAHTNRWNQLHIILYPIFILIPQNYSNFNFGSTTTRVCRPPILGGHVRLIQMPPLTIPHTIKFDEADYFVCRFSSGDVYVSVVCI